MIALHCHSFDGTSSAHLSFDIFRGSVANEHVSLGMAAHFGSVTSGVLHASELESGPER